MLIAGARRPSRLWPLVGCALWGTPACGDAFTSTSTVELLPEAGVNGNEPLPGPSTRDASASDGSEGLREDAGSADASVEGGRGDVDRADASDDARAPDDASVTDAGPTDSGAGDAGAGGAAGAAGGGGAAGSGGGCEPVPWYPDRDADGYGALDGVVDACDAPGEAWSSRAGDCHDGNSAVHPDQAAYFDGPYRGAAGESFDYDCDGRESGDPTQLGASPGCSGLALANCSGQGFVPTTRTGVGVNALCGSRALEQCVPELLICGGRTSLLDRGYACR